MKSLPSKKKIQKKKEKCANDAVPEWFRISIIGAGQIGGSLLLALKNNMKNAEITIWDKNKDILNKTAFIADRVAHSLKEAVMNADLIWIATPVNAIIELIPKIVRINSRALIADTGSTKMHIIRLVNAEPATFRFVGTHPLAGTEKTGPLSWNPDLFHCAPFFIIPSKKTRKEDLQIIKNIILKLNAIPHEISAKQHDRILAYTSHLLYLIAVSLKQMMNNFGLKYSAFFEGPAFASMTRIAQCPETLMQPILATNSNNIKKALTDFIKQLLKTGGKVVRLQGFEGASHDSYESPGNK